MRPEPRRMDAYCCQLVELRSALLRTARSRLRNPDWAEDAVSETILAALEHRPKFSEPERVKAWVFGILRYKLVDQIRRHLGASAASGLALGEIEAALDELPADERSNPVRRLIDHQFNAALNLQMACLPRMHARAFLLRECWGRSTEEICSELDVTANHLFVMLHRARGRLREKLVEHRA